MKQSRHVALQVRLEVDEHVTARNQVELRERGIPDEIVRRENAHLADILADLIPVVLPDEEPLQPLRSDVLGNAFGVACLTRELECLVVDVAREDLHLRHRVSLEDRFLEQDGDRVRLFAGGAAGRPYAKRAID